LLSLSCFRFKITQRYLILVIIWDIFVLIIWRCIKMLRPRLIHQTDPALFQFGLIMIRDFVLLFLYQVFDSLWQASYRPHCIFPVNHFQEFILSHFVMFLIKPLFLWHQALHAFKICLTILIIIFWLLIRIEFVWFILVFEIRHVEWFISFVGIIMAILVIGFILA